MTPQANSGTCPAFPEGRLFGRALREPGCASRTGAPCATTRPLHSLAPPPERAPPAAVPGRPSPAACQFHRSPPFPSQHRGRWLHTLFVPFPRSSVSPLTRELLRVGTRPVHHDPSPGRSELRSWLRPLLCGSGQGTRSLCAMDPSARLPGCHAAHRRRLGRHRHPEEASNVS